LVACGTSAAAIGPTMSAITVGGRSVEADDAAARFSLDGG
jgi:hypothetical protein